VAPACFRDGLYPNKETVKSNWLMRVYIECKDSLMNKVKLLVFALVGISTSAFAQSVDDIIAKSIQAKGGLAKLEAVQTIRMTANSVTANLAAGDTRARFTQVLKRRGKVHLDWSFQGFTDTNGPRQV